MLGFRVVSGDQGGGHGVMKKSPRDGGLKMICKECRNSGGRGGERVP